MSLRPQIEIELRKMRQAGNGGPLRLPTSCGQLLADIATVDSIGCAFNQLAVETPKLANADSARLKGLAERLSQRLTYLLEPIRVMEVDDHSCVVQMRSVPPTRRDRDMYYYEVLARCGGSVRVERFEKSPGNIRRAVPALLTLEAFLRLCDDLVAVVDELQ